MLKQPLRFSHDILKETIVSGDTVIDATVGNGNDTVLLAQLVGPFGKVYGFDIQEEAIKSTSQKLLLTGLTEQVELIQESHDKINEYLTMDTKISAVTFNLGYLPKGDKTITTQAHSTLEAIHQSLPLLRKQGIISIMIYSGHEGGMEEKNAVDDFVQNLEQTTYNVLTYQFVNQKNHPPYLYIIEKR